MVYVNQVSLEGYCWNHTGAIYIAAILSLHMESTNFKIHNIRSVGFHVSKVTKIK